MPWDRDAMGHDVHGHIRRRIAAVSLDVYNVTGRPRAERIKRLAFSALMEKHEEFSVLTVPKNEDHGADKVALVNDR